MEDKLVNTSTDTNKAVDDTINNKTKDVEKAVRSENIKEKLEDEANENVNLTKDVENLLRWIKLD